MGGWWSPKNLATPMPQGSARCARRALGHSTTCARRLAGKVADTYPPSLARGTSGNLAPPWGALPPCGPVPSGPWPIWARAHMAPGAFGPGPIWFGLHGPERSRFRPNVRDSGRAFESLVGRSKFWSDVRNSGRGLELPVGRSKFRAFE